MRPFFQRNPILGLLVLIATIPVQWVFAVIEEGWWQDFCDLWSELLEQRRKNNG